MRTPDPATMTVSIPDHHKARAIARDATNAVASGHVEPEGLAQRVGFHARPAGTLARTAYATRLALAVLTGRRITRTIDAFPPYPEARP